MVEEAGGSPARELLVSMPSPDGEGHFLSVVRSSSDVQLTELVSGRLFQYVDRGL